MARALPAERGGILLESGLPGDALIELVGGRWWGLGVEVLGARVGVGRRGIGAFKQTASADVAAGLIGARIEAGEGNEGIALLEGQAIERTDQAAAHDAANAADFA